MASGAPAEGNRDEAVASVDELEAVGTATVPESPLGGSTGVGAEMICKLGAVVSVGKDAGAATGEGLVDNDGDAPANTAAELKFGADGRRA